MKFLIVFSCFVAATYATFGYPVVPVYQPVAIANSNAVAVGKRIGRSASEVREYALRSKRGAAIATSNAIAIGRMGRAANDPPADSPASPAPSSDSNFQKESTNSPFRGQRDVTTANSDDKPVGWMDRAAKYLTQVMQLVQGAIKVLDVLTE